MQGLKFTNIAARACNIEGIPEPIGYAVIGSYGYGQAVCEYALADLQCGFPMLCSDRDQASVIANNLKGEVVDLEEWLLLEVASV